MIELPVTATIAALLGLIMFPLTVQISMRRKYLGEQAGNASKYTFGDANDDLLRNRIRAFGNFTEYVPMALILLALMEFHQAPHWLCWAIGGSFTAGRLVHALGMLVNPFKVAPRGVAMVITYFALVVPALWLIYKVWL